MFKDIKEGQTHSYGDGCIPPHTQSKNDETDLQSAIKEME